MNFSTPTRGVYGIASVQYERVIELRDIKRLVLARFGLVTQQRLK